MTTSTTIELADSVAHLHEVRRTVAERANADEPLAQVATAIIDCAAGVVAQLSSMDLAAAREALGCARAAVVAATRAVHVVHDRGRIELP